MSTAVRNVTLSHPHDHTSQLVSMEVNKLLPCLANKKQTATKAEPQTKQRLITDFEQLMERVTLWHPTVGMSLRSSCESQNILRYYDDLLTATMIILESARAHRTWLPSLATATQVTG